MDFSRLGGSLCQHFAALSDHRLSRAGLLRTYAGALYPGEKTRRPKDYINSMRQAVEAMTIGLTANQPRCLITSHNRDHKGFAAHMGRAISRYAERFHLQEAIEEWVRNAFFGLAVVKVCMADSPAVEIEADEWLDPGYPGCLSMSQDHFVYDTGAPHVRKAAFVADRYRVEFDRLVADTRFEKKIRDKLKDKRGVICAPLDDASQISRSTNVEDGLSEYVYLADVFIPRESRIYTFAVDTSFDFIVKEPLAEHQWEGQEDGPYHYLNFGPVPDNIYPSAPGLNLRLLHELVNKLYRKLARQAERQKELNFVQTNNDETGVRVRDATDGEYIPGDVQAVIPGRFGGPDQNTFSFVLNAMGQFNKAGGNVDSQLGVGTSADTLGQEQLIAQQVGAIKGFYAQRLNRGVAGVMREIGRLLFYDELTELPGTEKVPGTDIAFNDTWYGSAEPGSRLGKYDDYEINVDPYSMAFSPPEARAARLRQIVTGELLPAVPGAQQMFNIQKYLETLSRYENLPELADMFPAGNEVPPPPQGQGSSGGGNGGEYIHRNVSSGGGNPEQEQVQMMQGSEQ